MINVICQTLRFFYSWNNVRFMAVRNWLFFTCHSIMYKNLYHLSGTESNHVLSNVHFPIIHSRTVFFISINVSHLLQASCVIVANLTLRLIFSLCSAAVILPGVLLVPIIKAVLQFSQIGARYTEWHLSNGINRSWVIL